MWTGKTFTSLQIAQKNIENKQSSITIMLFPSLYLIDQTKKEWEQQTYIDNWLLGNIWEKCDKEI